MTSPSAVLLNRALLVSGLGIIYGDFMGSCDGNLGIAVLFVDVIAMQDGLVLGCVVVEQTVSSSVPEQVGHNKGHFSTIKM